MSRARRFVAQTPRLAVISLVLLLAVPTGLVAVSEGAALMPLPFNLFLVDVAPSRHLQVAHARLRRRLAADPAHHRRAPRPDAGTSRSDASPPSMVVLGGLTVAARRALQPFGRHGARRVLRARASCGSTLIALGVIAIRRRRSSPTHAAPDAGDGRGRLGRHSGCASRRRSRPPAICRSIRFTAASPGRDGWCRSPLVTLLPLPYVAGTRLAPSPLRAASTSLPAHDTIQRHLPSHRDHGRAAQSRERLPVGPRADLRDDRALHHRGGLRGGRRDRARRSRRPEGRAWRSAAAGRLSRAHGRGAPGVRVRRRRRGDHLQDDPPPPARVRHGGRSVRPEPRRASGIAPKRRRKTADNADAGLLDDVPVGAARR